MAPLRGRVRAGNRQPSGSAFVGLEPTRATRRRRDAMVVSGSGSATVAIAELVSSGAGVLAVCADASRRAELASGAAGLARFNGGAALVACQRCGGRGPGRPGDSRRRRAGADRLTRRWRANRRWRAASSTSSLVDPPRSAADESRCAAPRVGADPGFLHRLWPGDQAVLALRSGRAVGLAADGRRRLPRPARGRRDERARYGSGPGGDRHRPARGAGRAGRAPAFAGGRRPLSARPLRAGSGCRRAERGRRRRRRRILREARIWSAQPRSVPTERRTRRPGNTSKDSNSRRAQRSPRRSLRRGRGVRLLGERERQRRHRAGGGDDRPCRDRARLRLRLRAPRRPDAPLGRRVHHPPGRGGPGLRRDAARHRDPLRGAAARHRRGHQRQPRRDPRRVRRGDRPAGRRRHQADRDDLREPRRAPGRELPQDDGGDGHRRQGDPDQAGRPPPQHAHARRPAEAEADGEVARDAGDLRAARPPPRHPRDQVGAGGPRLRHPAPAQVRRDQAAGRPAARRARELRLRRRRVPRRGAGAGRDRGARSPAAPSTSTRSTRRWRRRAASSTRSSTSRRCG